MQLFNASGNYLIGEQLPLATRGLKVIPNERAQDLPIDALRHKERFMPFAAPGNPGPVLRSLSWQYNCAGLVLANRRTVVHIKEARWVLADDGYRQIPRAEADLGDVVIYMNGDEDTHIGLVWRKRKGLTQAELQILSKWGQHGEYLHDELEVPDLYGKPSHYFTERAR